MGHLLLHIHGAEGLSTRWCYVHFSVLRRSSLHVQLAVEAGKLAIRQEGRLRKFKTAVQEKTFAGSSGTHAGAGCRLRDGTAGSC